MSMKHFSSCDHLHYSSYKHSLPHQAIFWGVFFAFVKLTRQQQQQKMQLDSLLPINYSTAKLLEDFPVVENWLQSGRHMWENREYL